MTIKTNTTLHATAATTGIQSIVLQNATDHTIKYALYQTVGLW